MTKLVNDNAWSDLRVLRDFMRSLPHTKDWSASSTFVGRTKQRLKDIING